MTLQDRSEILSRLYKLQAETVATIFLCREFGAPSVMETLEKNRDSLQERIDDMKGANNES